MLLHALPYTWDNPGGNLERRALPALTQHSKHGHLVQIKIATIRKQSTKRFIFIWLPVSTCSKEGSPQLKHTLKTKSNTLQQGIFVPREIKNKLSPNPIDFINSIESLIGTNAVLRRLHIHTNRRMSCRH